MDGRHLPGGVDIDISNSLLRLKRPLRQVESLSRNRDVSGEAPEVMVLEVRIPGITHPGSRGSIALPVRFAMTHGDGVTHS